MTTLTANQPVTFYNPQYKSFTKYPAGTQFRLVRWATGIKPKSAKVIAPGGIVGQLAILEADTVTSTQ